MGGKSSFDSPSSWIATIGRGRRLVFLIAMIAALLLPALVPQWACAETYPSRPITIIIPLAAGGAIDAVARFLQPKLEQTLGQAVIIVDRPGASGLVGANAVARARPDGYTLLMTPSTFTVDPAVNSKLPYDVQRDFQPIAVVAENSMLLVVNANMPVHSIADFVNLAKASPGKINYATPGNFSQARLLMRLGVLKRAFSSNKFHSKVPRRPFWRPLPAKLK